MSDELPLRTVDLTVLNEISRGRDLQQITENTVHDNGKVNHCFTKLEELGLIRVEHPDGYTTRIVNGQKRTFRTPKRGEITEEGEVVLSEQEIEPDKYESLSRNELIWKVRELERQLDELESQFRMFQQQVRTRLKEMEGSE